jgi:hypothetical protein
MATVAMQCAMSKYGDGILEGVHSISLGLSFRIRWWCPR